MTTDEIPGLVSVVMPFHNAGKFLSDAVDSVLAQRYPSWELLLVDDGSDDGSASLALAYARRDPERIRYLKHAGGGRGGASAARNLGLAHARGEFIGFLDADDVWLPRKLEEQVPLLREHPEAGLLYGRTRYWYSWSGRPEDRARDYVPRLHVPAGVVIPPPELLVACLSARAAVPCTCSLLVRRAVVRATGGFEERFRRVYTDQAFYSKLLLAAAALPIDACWDQYRQHPESSSATAGQAEERRAARLAYLEWLDAYLHEHAPADRIVRRTLRREAWRCRHPLGDDLLDRLEHLRRRLGDVVAGFKRRAPGR